MRVAVIGAEGALGKRIAAECAERGYSVSALPARPEELRAERLRGFDAVVDAVLPTDDCLRR